MRKRSIQRIGGIGAIGGAFCSVAFVFLITFHSVSAGYTEGPSPRLILADYALALAGLFGLAVVPALSRRVLHVSPGVVYWLSIIAQVGFGLLAVMSFWQAEYETNLSIETSRIPVVPYEEATDVTEVSFPLSVAIQEITTRAPRGWLESAGVGIWIFVVSCFARTNGLFSPMLAQVGLSAGASAVLVSLGAAFQLVTFQLFGLINFLVLYPVWFGWVGLILLRADMKPFPRLRFTVQTETPPVRGRWTNAFHRHPGRFPRKKEITTLHKPTAP